MAPPSTSSISSFVKHYFMKSFSYEEILYFLSKYRNKSISMRQLHRILRKEGLYRRQKKTKLNSVISAIKDNIDNHSGKCFGYRLMTQKLRNSGVTIDRETVRLCIKSLDPEGVDNRTAHRLYRRVYTSVGPNFLWHIDGYDKLKPYGFAIHGAIDGYSRRILWLTVASSNNNPKIVAAYYLKCVKDLGLLPRCIRGDRGTENGIVCGIQRFFRRYHGDSSAGKYSFLYGSSTSNQRIESWWSILKRSRTVWWIHFFKDMVDAGILDLSLKYHIDCLRYCFLGIIQSELDETAGLWNSHRIREVRNAECPGGRPDVLYYACELVSGTDCRFPISTVDISLAENYTEMPCVFGVSKEMIQLCKIIMDENHLAIPNQC